MTEPFPGKDHSRHMGELKRGDQRWEVYLEIQPDTTIGAVRGRIHFVGPAGGGGSGGGGRRTTGWVFLEMQEREIVERFGEFSAVELLHFVEAL